MKQNITAVIEYYNRKAEEYDEEYEEPYWKLYQDITWHNIKRFLLKNKDALLLDAGGGTGYWAIKLAELGCQVVLTDVSKNMLRVAEEKIKKEKLGNKIETQLVDICEMSCFPKNHFDVVLAEGDPVSYCLDAEKAVRELARVVKSNCPVIISVDNKFGFIGWLINSNKLDKIPEFLKTGIIESEFTFQTFTPSELKQLLEKCLYKDELDDYEFVLLSDYIEAYIDTPPVSMTRTLQIL